MRGCTTSYPAPTEDGFGRGADRYRRPDPTDMFYLTFRDYFIDFLWMKRLPFAVFRVVG